MEEDGVVVLEPAVEGVAAFVVFVVDGEVGGIGGVGLAGEEAGGVRPDAQSAHSEFSENGSSRVEWLWDLGRGAGESSRFDNSRNIEQWNHGVAGVHRGEVDRYKPLRAVWTPAGMNE